MARDELGIVPFITHKLPIVLAMSDRVTVLRRGKVVASLGLALYLQGVALINFGNSFPQPRGMRGRSMAAAARAFRLFIIP